MVNNKNLFRESVVFGNFVNCDDIKTGGNQANAKFKRNVLIGGDLQLGLSNSTTTNGVTAYTDTGGNIIVKKNEITYTLTPTILSHLSTISSNIQDQIDNITTPDLSSYALKDSPSFTGTALAPTPTSDKNNTEIATTAFVKAQGYLTTSPDLSSYAKKSSPEFTGTPLAPTPTSIYDKSTKIVTTEWVQNLIEKVILSTKVFQYIVAYTNDYLVYPLNPTYNVLGKNYYNYIYGDAELFGGYLMISSGTGISSGYGWNDGIWKASTEGRYYVEIKLVVTYLSGNDNQFVLYIKDTNNTIITSKTIYSATSGQTTINYKTGIVIPENGYFTIIKEGGNDINLTWGNNYYTNSDTYASIRITQIY